MKTENLSKKSPYLLRLVWFNTGLAILAGLASLLFIWWTILDIRNLRQEHFMVKEYFNTMLMQVDQKMADQKLVYFQLLDEKDPHDESAHSRFDIDIMNFMADHREGYERHGFGDEFSLLEKQINQAKALEANCRRWMILYLTNQEDLVAGRKEVGVALRNFQEEIDRAYGLRRLAAAIRLKHLPHSTPNSIYSFDQLSLEEDIIDLSDLLKDLADVALLVEQLRAEQNSDYLADIKDNKLRTALIRLRRNITLLPVQSKMVRSTLIPLLDRFEETVFGVNYFIDNDYQTVTLGQGGYYGLRLQRLGLISDRNTLRHQIEKRFDELLDITQSVQNTIDTALDKKGQGVEKTLQQTWLNIFIVTCLIGLFFVLAATWIISEIKKQVQAIEDTNFVLDSRTKALLLSQQELNDSKLRLEYLSSSLLNAQDMERKRIARELHDEFGAAMASLKLQVRATEKCFGEEIPEKLHERCNSLRLAINEIIENVRRLSRDLSPTVLEDLGLEAALEHLCENFAELHQVDMQVKLKDINLLVKENDQRNIYRIVQELLTNIGKHAGAKNVIIETRKVHSSIQFVIEDEGCGFDIDKQRRIGSPERGMGLSTITERVRILRGTINIVSQPGKGTQITFTAPL